MTQSVFFESDFDWGGSNEGGKFGFGVGGGSNPTGGLIQTDGFSLRLHWRGNKDGTARITAYSYAADRAQNLPFGDDYPFEGFTIPTGKWIDITFEIVANSSIDAADGSIRAWVDGELRLLRSNIQWQTSGGQPEIQKFIFATFHGGNDSSWAPSRTNFIRFSDVCWAPVVNTSTSALNDGENNRDDAIQLIFDDVIRQSSRIQISDTLRELELLMPMETPAVSYTHLTLPTICSV